MKERIYKAEAVFSDRPNGETKVEFNFHELSPETLTPMRTLQIEEATQMIESSKALKLAYLLLEALREELNTAERNLQ